MNIQTVPQPPAAPFKPLFQAAMDRRGLTLGLSVDQHELFWAVASNDFGSLRLIDHGVISVSTKDVMAVVNALPKLHHIFSYIAACKRAFSGTSPRLFIKTCATPSPRIFVVDQLRDLGLDVEEAAPHPAVAQFLKDSLEAFITTHRAAELARALNSGKTLAVQVSTDASKGKSTTAGLGWVIDFQHADPRNKLTAPRLGFDLRESRSILEAELHAISTGLKKALSWCNGLEPQLTAANITPTFVVRSDSQIAIHLLDGTLSQDAVVSKNVDVVLTELKSIAQRHPVEFTWVRGHNGDQGNEFADRLAVFARRTHESAIEPERQQQTFEVIRRDYLATR